MADIDCRPLSETPHAVPELARRFVRAWPEHYAGSTAAEVEADFPVAGEGLPLIFTAHRGGVLCGTAALRGASIHAFSRLTPWIGGLLVFEPFRRQGVATALIAAVAAEARRRGFPSCYAGTVEAQGLFDALGWRRVGEAVQEGQAVTVYERPPA